MIKSPIWKDIEYHNDNFSTLDYYLADEGGNILHRGYTMRMPDQTGITININTRLEEYLDPDFDSDIREADDNVVSNSNAYKNFQMRDKQVQGLIGEFGFLYDWSYEDRWTGQTKYLMTQPINGHIDSRMKSMFTMMNTASTNFDWEIQFDSQLTMNPSKLYFDVSGGTSAVTVSSNECWQITSIPSWLSASVTSDCGSYSSITNTQITFTAAPYTGTDERVGSVVFTTPSGTYTLPVTQGKFISVGVTPSSLSFIYSGETKSVSVVSNGVWNVVSYPDWINIPVRSGSGNLNLLIEAISNPTQADRSGTIVIETVSESATISVSQNHLYFSVSPSSLTYVYSGETKQVTVSSTRSWSISSKPEWITASVSSGTGNTTVDLVAEFNLPTTSRTGNVVFDNGVETRVVTVEQAGAPIILTVTPSSYTYPQNGGYAIFTVSANTNWSITTIPDWLTVQTISGGPGVTNRTISTTGVNTTSRDYSGTIVFSGEGISTTVNVYQKWYQTEISISPTSHTFTYTGGSQVFTVTSNVSFNLASDSDWLVVNGRPGEIINGGTGTTRITATTQQNQTQSVRTGRIMALAADGTMVSATVRQNNTSLTLSVSPVQLGWSYTGGTRQLTVTSNYGWAVSSTTSSWVTLSPSSGGSGTTIVTVDANANFSGSYRTGQIVLYNTDCTATVSLGQEDGSSGDYWIVCTFNFPSSGRKKVANDLSSLDTVMIVDGYQTNASTYYDFDTSGTHIVKFRVQGASGPIGTNSNTTAFKDVPYLTNLYIPENVEGLKNCCFSGCTDLTGVTIENGAFTYFGEGSFIDCISLKSIVFPATTRYMNGDVFSGCSGLTSVTMNEGLVRMGENEFPECISLTQITIPDSVTGCGDTILAFCYGLTQVTIGSGLTNLPYGMFMGCTSLNEVVIPSNITNIEGWVFYDSSVTSIRCYPTTSPSTEFGTFSGLPSSGVFHYPQNGSGYDLAISRLPSGWTAVADL